MSDKEQEMDMGFTQEILPDCHHVCLIYDNEEQRRKIVSKYLAAGLKQGEFVGYFADTTPREDVLAWLSETGVDSLKAVDDGAFGVVKAGDAYCPSGRFVPQDVLDRVTARYTLLKQSNYTGSRIAGEMTWALRRDILDTDRLLEYEVGLNMITDPFPHIGMCQYDTRLFDGATLFKILQVHPYMIAQGKIVRNPYYIQPEEFLEKPRTS